eukprot:scaffold43.g4487.t1
MGIIQDLLATTDRGRLKAVQATISLWKNAQLDPDGAERSAITPGDVEAARIYRSYNATLAAYQAVDFDDLIYIPAQLLEHHAEVRDDDQAIYTWRGATIENLAKLTTDYPGIKLIKLEQNYRSVQRILAAANKVLEQNPKFFEKTLWSDLGTGEPIVVSAMDSEEHEAESIAMKISAARFERQAKWKDFAILYRSNHQSRPLEQALRNLKIPYTLAGGPSFFDKAEVRDILSYLRLIANDDDDPAFIRAATTPKRGIGQATLQTLGQYAAARELSLMSAATESGLESLLQLRQLEPLRTFAEFIRRLQWRAGRGAAHGNNVTSAEPAGPLLDDLLHAIQYERHLYDTLDERAAQGRWENVCELIGWLKRKAEEDSMTLYDLVQHVALITMLERDQEGEPDAVKLSTLHASKGLEYPHVYLAGVEEGLLPHLGKDETDGDPARAAENLTLRIQEERRLVYVGITRAQRSLNLSWCKKRRKAREEMVREPSRFIDEMGLGTARIAEDEATQAMSPKQRLSMLKTLLKKA